MMYKKISVLLILFFCSIIYNEVLGHPVIWKDGVVVSSKITELTKEIKTHYSITNKWAIGMHGIKLDDTTYGMVQNNFLLKRWNKEGSQANIYLFSGVGSSVKNEKKTISHLGFQADWETRSIYTHLSLDSYFKENPIHLISTRLGISPYLVEYEGLSTWIILQVDGKVQDNEHQVNMMPVLRLFKDNLLLEFGSNFFNKYLITAMIHF